jgi:AcrR family transcriptional regulator
MSCSRFGVMAISRVSKCDEKVSDDLQQLLLQTMRNESSVSCHHGPVEQAIDGRTARSLRTQRLIVDALLELVRQGDPSPTVARIAEQAGVSDRLIYHHFEDGERLLEVATARQVELVTGKIRALPSDGPLPVRIRALVAQRSRVLEWITPVRRMALRHEPTSARLRESRDKVLALATQELARTFADELAALDAATRRTTLAALDAVTGWGAWEHWRASGLTEAAARKAMAAAVTALLRAD